MRLISISERGLDSVKAVRIWSDRFLHHFYSVHSGVLGEDMCWQIRIPIPVDTMAPGPAIMGLDGMHFSLVDLKKKDRRGQSCYLLERGHEDDEFLVFLEADRTSTVDLAGKVRVLPAVGHDLNKKFFLLRVEGKCWIRVTRTGRVRDGEPSEFLASFTDREWAINRRYIFEEV
jgi:hypothetical protein